MLYLVCKCRCVRLPVSLAEETAGRIRARSESHAAWIWTWLETERLTSVASACCTSDLRSRFLYLLTLFLA